MAVRLRALYPRFLLVVAAVPLAFLGTLVALTRFGFTETGQMAAALFGAATFAAAVLAPSTMNALARVGVLLGAVVLANLVAAATNG